MQYIYTRKTPLSRQGGLWCQKPCLPCNAQALCRFIVLFFLCLCPLLQACGAAEQPKPSLEAKDPALVLWPRAEKAITLHLATSRDLNLFESKAHSIQICVYQMDSKEAFIEKAASAEGILELLKAAPFDDSVKTVTRLFLQPFEEKVLKLDRAENATFVGIVAGFFDAAPDQSAKVWQIQPKAVESFWSSTTYSAGTLELTLRLASNAIVEIMVEKTDKKK